MAAGDTKFIFSCWKNISRVSAANEWNIFWQSKTNFFISALPRNIFYLLYRYWWNTRIFPFTKKSCLHHIQWRYYFYLSCEDIGVAMVTNINFDFWNRKYKYYYLYFSFITLYPSFITFCDRHFVIGDHFNCTTLLFRKWIKKSCVLCRNFIRIYKINRTFHGRLGLRILSSRAESISYFQHSKIKFVSPRCHVISSIYTRYKVNVKAMLRSWGRVW